MIRFSGEDSLSKTEPYLEHIESKEIKKLIHRLYQDQPDRSITTGHDMKIHLKETEIKTPPTRPTRPPTPTPKHKSNQVSQNSQSSPTQDYEPNLEAHDYIASEIDKLLDSNDELDKHAEPIEPTSTEPPEPKVTESPLPEFPATEKPKKIEKPQRPEKKRGFFNFFKK